MIFISFFSVDVLNPCAHFSDTVYLNGTPFKIHTAIFQDFLAYFLVYFSVWTSKMFVFFFCFVAGFVTRYCCCCAMFPIPFVSSKSCNVFFCCSVIWTIHLQVIPTSCCWKTCFFMPFSSTNLASKKISFQNVSLAFGGWCLGKICNKEKIVNFPQPNKKE